MLKISPAIIAGVRATKTAQDLWPYLQNAIELEHATIPPYLTAMFSLKSGTNREIWNIIHSVVIEEMLHMTIAANILNALAGSPDINNPSFIPSYPTPLPMNIGDGLVVGLAKYSKDQVKNVFMEIEEPEDPIEFSRTATVAQEYNTIGEFYDAIKAQIAALPFEQMPGNPDKQVTSSFFSSEELFPILTKTDAMNAIDIIVEQGEGTATSPLDPEGEYAHYYRFEELYVGKQLVADAGAPNGYSFTGPDIPYTEADVYNIMPNTKAEFLPPGSQEKRYAEEFNFYYSKLLNGLHVTFNGQPDFLGNTLGLMFDIKLAGEKLCATPYPGMTGTFIGPPFQFVDVTIPTNA